MKNVQAFHIMQNHNSSQLHCIFGCCCVLLVASNAFFDWSFVCFISIIIVICYTFILWKKKLLHITVPCEKWRPKMKHMWYIGLKDHKQCAAKRCHFWFRFKVHFQIAWNKMTVLFLLGVVFPFSLFPFIDIYIFLCRVWLSG